MDLCVSQGDNNADLQSIGGLLHPKGIVGVLEGKAPMTRELNKLKPSLNFFNAARMIQPKRWKKFKLEYNGMHATIQVLLEAPKKDYFVIAELVSNKNRSIEELSSYAKEFFKVFLL